MDRAKFAANVPINFNKDTSDQSLSKVMGSSVMTDANVLVLHEVEMRLNEQSGWGVYWRLSNGTLDFEALKALYNDLSLYRSA